VKNQITLSLDL